MIATWPGQGRRPAIRPPSPIARAPRSFLHGGGAIVTTTRRANGHPTISADPERSTSNRSAHVVPPRSGGAPDAAVGIVFGALAGSNLVQGSWINDLPWFNLTAAAFILAVPITITALKGRSTTGAALLGLLLMAALTLGYLEPALSSAAAAKRSNLLLGVAFVFLASYLSLQSPQRVRWFFITVISLAVPVVVGQAVRPDPLALTTGRLTPVGLNAIGAGRASGAALVLVLTLLVSPRTTRRRLLLVVLAIVFGVSLYLAGSRGPVVGVLIAITFIVWLHPSLHRVPKIAMLSTLGLITVVAYRGWVSSNVRLASLSTSGRDDLYAQALSIALEHPLGIGWGNFNRFASAGLLRADRGENLYAHNIVLEFWIEAGVLGALAFVTFAAAILVKAVNGSAKPGAGLAWAALLVFLITGAMLSSDVIGNRMLWVVFGAVLAAQARAEDSDPFRSKFVKDESRRQRGVRRPG